jgi:hypothetical protein
MNLHMLSAPDRQYSLAWQVSTPHVKGTGVAALASANGVAGLGGVATGAPPSSKSGELVAPLHPARLPTVKTDPAKLIRKAMRPAKRSRPRRLLEAE